MNPPTHGYRQWLEEKRRIYTNAQVHYMGSVRCTGKWMYVWKSLKENHLLESLSPQEMVDLNCGSVLHVPYHMDSFQEKHVPNPLPFD